MVVIILKVGRVLMVVIIVLGKQGTGKYMGLHDHVSDQSTHVRHVRQDIHGRHHPLGEQGTHGHHHYLPFEQGTHGRHHPQGGQGTHGRHHRLR